MYKKIYILVLMTICILCVNKVYAYGSYKVGDKITYNSEDYYVIEDSDANQSYVTLLKEKPLTAEELYKYGRDENDNLFINKYSIDGNNPEQVVNELGDGIGGIAYYTGETCGQYFYFNGSITINEKYVTEGCINNYENSDVKKVVDNWASKNFNSTDLIKVDGYKVRLLNANDLNQLGYSNQMVGTGIRNRQTEDTPDWVYDNEYSYWTMDPYYADYSANKYMFINLISNCCINDKVVFSRDGAVRPVINLNKNVLDCKNGYTYEKQKVKKYNEFKIGDEITYQGGKYYVIEDSDNYTKYITLLKADPLTSDEINKYKGDLDFTSENNGMPYYKSNACYDKDNIMGCINDYNQSYVKQVIDKWSSNFDDLVEIDGYKTRLLNEEDLYRLGYERKTGVITANNLCKTEETPEWVYNNDYWIMYGIGDSNNVYEVTKKECIYVGSSGYQEFYKGSLNTYELSAVRPVINLDKCAVDGGCYEKEVEVAVGCKDTNDNTNDNVVNVPSTLKNISITIFVICGILVASGIGIIIFNYIKARKERDKG